MTILLELPSGVEEALTREAQRQGTTPESLILGDLQRLYPPAPDTEQRGRHTALAGILARAQAATPAPPALKDKDAMGEAVADKFRGQGFHL